MRSIKLNHIKKIRKEMNMSQQELANKCDLSRSAISDVENFISIPNQLTMLLICFGLQRNLHEVFETDYNILNPYFGRNSDIDN
jgi:transcriptional regulator with XRE-family HTH domain